MRLRMRRGYMFSRVEISTISRRLLYRGVYDSVYDLTPGMRTRREFTGERVDKRFNDLDDYDRHARDALKFENVLREAYVDVKLGGPLRHLSLRAGRQQIIWG